MIRVRGAILGTLVSLGLSPCVLGQWNREDVTLAGPVWMPGLSTQETPPAEPAPSDDADLRANDPLSFDKGKGEKKWSLDVQPYIWIPGIISIDSTIGGITVPLNVHFSDIWDNFDVFAISGRMEAWYDDTWGITLDALYSHLDGDFSAPNGLPLNLEIEQIWVELGAGYRVLNTSPSDNTQYPRFVADALGGIRWGSLTQRGKIQNPPGLQVGGSADYFEPFVGGRLGLQLDRNLLFIVRGDVGGFGIGNASDLTWKCIVGGQYRFSEKFALNLGWQFYGIDFENGTGPGRFGLNGTLHGPFIGFYLQF